MWGEIGAVIAIVISLLSLAGTFYAVKIKVAVNDEKISSLEKQNDILHKRIDAAKAEAVNKTDTLSEEIAELKVDMSDLKVQMAENKTEIINEIHKLNKNT